MVGLPLDYSSGSQYLLSTDLITSGEAFMIPAISLTENPSETRAKIFSVVDSCARVLRCSAESLDVFPSTPCEYMVDRAFRDPVELRDELNFVAIAL